MSWELEDVEFRRVLPPVEGLELLEGIYQGPDGDWRIVAEVAIEGTVIVLPSELADEVERQYLIYCNLIRQFG